MKKILILTILFMIAPIIARADECTDEMIKEYEQYATKIVITPTRLDNSNTFEVWVKGVSNGLVVEHGRTVLDEGFLGYAQAGDNYMARVYVGYGACNGQTIKEIKVDLPKQAEQCEEGCKEEEVATPPTVVEKPTTNTEVKKPTTNDTQQKPSNNSSDSKEENITNNNLNKQEEAVVQKPSVDEEQTPTTDKDNNKEEADIKDNISDNYEDTSGNNSTIDDNTESEQDSNIDNVETDNNKIDDENNNNNYIDDIIIFTVFSFLAIIFYIIIKSKKIKLSK